jgi:hypothetical protein
MGKIIVSTILFFSFLILRGQNKEKTMVIVTEKDSVEYLVKSNSQFLKFYFLDHIQHNKSQKKQTMAGGYILCETCKKESYSISVISIKKPSVKLRKISVNDFLFKNHGYSDIIYFKNKYYKYNGRIID